MRWVGRVFAPRSGTYRFCVLHDDGARLWVQDQLVVDWWGGTPPRWDCGNIALSGPRWSDIRLEYFENGGGAVIQLAWNPPHQANQVPVPAWALMP